MSESGIVFPTGPYKRSEPPYKCGIAGCEQEGHKWRVPSAEGGPVVRGMIVTRCDMHAAMWVGETLVRVEEGGE